MTSLAAFAVIQFLLLVIEWRRRSIVARILAVVLALIQLYFSQPFPPRAARAAMGVPHTERVTTFGPTDTTFISEYASGILTMERAMERDIRGVSNDQLMGIAILLWLALTPLLRPHDLVRLRL
jgi:hypothetical protein